jgi:hypothetical protein
MSKLLSRNYVLLFLAICSVFMLGMNFLPNDLIDPFAGDTPPANNNENTGLSHPDLSFNPTLVPRIQSVDDLVEYARKQVIISGKSDTDKQAMMETLGWLGEARFRHAYSVYGLHDNWIAVVLGKLVWPDLAAIVDPDDILKHPTAACSQVSLVLMKAAKILKIPTRKVGFEGHFSIEARINDKWYFIDANRKPDFSVIGGRKGLAEIIDEGMQYQLYSTTGMDSVAIDRMFSVVQYYEPDAPIAVNALIFHKVTKVLSHWGWLLPAAAFAYGLRLSVHQRRRRGKKVQNEAKLFAES